MNYWNDKAPITTTYWLREQDVKNLEREAKRWKRAALRVARDAEWHACIDETLQKSVDKVRKLNGGTL